MPHNCVPLLGRWVSVNGKIGSEVYHDFGHLFVVGTTQYGHWQLRTEEVKEVVGVACAQLVSCVVADEFPCDSVLEKTLLLQCLLLKFLFLSTYLAAMRRGFPPIRSDIEKEPT